MIQNLNWPTLEIRRTRARLIMLYKIIHHHVAIYPENLLLAQDLRTRHSSIYRYRHIGTSKDSYKYSFYPRTISQWNMLPITAYEAATIQVFKTIVTVPVIISSIHI